MAWSFPGLKLVYVGIDSPCNLCSPCKFGYILGVHGGIHGSHKKNAKTQKGSDGDDGEER